MPTTKVVGFPVHTNIGHALTSVYENRQIIRMSLDATCARHEYEDRLAASDLHIRFRKDGTVKHILRGLLDKVRLPRAEPFDVEPGDNTVMWIRASRLLSLSSSALRHILEAPKLSDGRVAQIDLASEMVVSFIDFGFVADAVSR
ncbi:unnamed protein product [Penicillium crustosum]